MNATTTIQCFLTYSKLIVNTISEDLIVNKLKQ